MIPKGTRQAGVDGANLSGGRRGKECELASNDWRRGGAASPGPYLVLCGLVAHSPGGRELVDSAGQLACLEIDADTTRPGEAERAAVFLDQLHLVASAG
jgi:hypothetical protein